LNLLIKKIDNDGRLALVPEYLVTDWKIAVVDSDDRMALSSALRDADAMISMDWPADMPDAPALKLIQLPGAGTDDIAFDSVPRSAAVCNVYEHEIGIAEYVLAAMLHFTVQIPRLDAALKRGEWWGSHLCGPRHGELYGKTLGIVGYGRIGRQTASRASAFGMRVVACSRTAGGADGPVDRIVPMSGLHAVLAESDFVLLALPLDDSTHGVIGARELAQMKPTGVIINVARGGLIDESALFQACRDKRIGGAAIDAWYRYPRANNPRGRPSTLPFHELDNVVMTPHASAWTDGLRPRRNRVIAENLDRLARGDPLLNVVRAAGSRTGSIPR
jgi:phosphoglycerate dehydrogenase-like enzyme